jgi:pimeloyl-ACP methyl ester carboxylesterase
MQYQVKELGRFKYVEEGEGEPLVLLHGLFGALSNFKDLVEHFRQQYKVIVPLLPLFELDILHTTVGGLAKHVHKFLEARDLRRVHLLGNSLGGHVALLHTLKHPERIKSLILTGSSGLFENGMGDTYPKRGDHEYIRKKTELTFYDPAMATEELVNEVFDITRNRLKVIKIIAWQKAPSATTLAKNYKTFSNPPYLCGETTIRLHHRLWHVNFKN